MKYRFTRSRRISDLKCHMTNKKYRNTTRKEKKSFHSTGFHSYMSTGRSKGLSNDQSKRKLIKTLKIFVLLLIEKVGFVSRAVQNFLKNIYFRKLDLTDMKMTFPYICRHNMYVRRTVNDIGYNTFNCKNYVHCTLIVHTSFLPALYKIFSTRFSDFLHTVSKCIQTYCTLSVHKHPSMERCSGKCKIKLCRTRIIKILHCFFGSLYNVRKHI